MGDSSASQSVDIIAANFPESPMIPSLVSQSPYEITIEWIAPGDNGMPITSYDVYWNGLDPYSLDYTLVSTISMSTGRLLQETDTDVNLLQYTNTDVVPGVVYKFKVLATSAVGDSALSSPITIKAAQKPDAPSMPTLISQSSDSISIEWTAPSDNFDAILDYNVYWDFGI
jgi:hypothetical protein